MKTNKLLVAVGLATAIGVPIAGFAEDLNMSQPMTSTQGRLAFLHGFLTAPTSSQRELASLDRANEWLNSPPLTAEGLRGKVVLVNVWTYTCINWFRQLPYVRGWAEKYKDQGLVVIGVHSPDRRPLRNRMTQLQGYWCPCPWPFNLMRGWSRRGHAPAVFLPRD